MKKLISSTLALAIALLANGQDYRQYYQDMPVAVNQPARFTIPSREVNIKDFGGKGDGITLNTEAFAGAIAELSAQGGGRLNVPEGIWLTGPIELKSNIELHLERNAIIYFSPDKSLFIDTSEGAYKVKAGIHADRCENIAITGEGTIDGNGAQWRPVKRVKVSDTEWKQFLRMGGVELDNGNLWYPWEMKSGYEDIADTPEKQEKMRNDIFRVNYCKGIYLQGVTFQNSPKFHVHPINCSDIIMDGITVRCPWNAQNGDAIDLSDCHRALIVNCIVDAGDDGICMKSGSAKKKTENNGCEDILIQDNIVYHGHGGFVIGSESICGMRRIVVRDCTFSGTDTGLRFKSNPGRGGKCEDIYISNIMMTDITDEAIIFQCDYADRPAGSKDSDIKAPEPTNIPDFTDIHISDVVCRGCKTGIRASGVEGMNCVHGITISNSTIVYTSKGEVIDRATAEITLDNVKLVKDKK